MNYKYLWQDNRKGVDESPTQEVIKGVIREANVYMRKVLIEKKLDKAKKVVYTNRQEGN